MQNSHTLYPCGFGVPISCLDCTRRACLLSSSNASLDCTRYETAFQILHKLRAGMVRPDRDRIGGAPDEHVEVDESLVGGATRGQGRGVHDKTLVACRRGSPQEQTQGQGCCASPERSLLRVVSGWKSCRIVRQNRWWGLSRRAVEPGAVIVTDGWSAITGLTEIVAIAICRSPSPEAPALVDDYLPIVLSRSAISKAGSGVATTASARSTCRRISMSSPFALTGDSTRLTHSGPCSGSVVER